MKLVATALAVALLAAVGAGSASGAVSAGIDPATAALPATAEHALAPAPSTPDDPAKDDPTPKRDGPVEKLRAVLDRLVAAGTITSAQAKAIADAAKDALAAKPKKPEAKAKQARAGEFHFTGQILKVVRDHLGVAQKDIAENAKAGRSLAELAVAKGKTRDSLIAAILATQDKPSPETKDAVAKLVDAKGRPNAGKGGKDKD